MPAEVEGVSYRDPASGVTYKVEIDGRHIRALTADGKPLWRHDPFVEGKLEPYRQARPTIYWIGPFHDWSKDHKFDPQHLGVSFTSSQFGRMDVKTGAFAFMGQD